MSHTIVNYEKNVAFIKEEFFSMEGFLNERADHLHTEIYRIKMQLDGYEDHRKMMAGWLAKKEAELVEATFLLSKIKEREVESA